MSLEELKRVTEAYDGISYATMLILALKFELNNVQRKHNEESEANENLIAELRKRIQDIEGESAPKTDLSQEITDLETQLASKQAGLEQALEKETALKKEIEQLRQQLSDNEAQLSKVGDFWGLADCVGRGRFVVASGTSESKPITSFVPGHTSNISR